MPIVVWIALVNAPLALLAGLFAFLYFREKKHFREAQHENMMLVQHHSQSLDNIRTKQAERELELNGLLMNYGSSTLEGIQCLTALAEQLRDNASRRTKNDL